MYTLFDTLSLTFESIQNCAARLIHLLRFHFLFKCHQNPVRIYTTITHLTPYRFISLMQPMIGIAFVPMQFMTHNTQDNHSKKKSCCNKQPLEHWPSRGIWRLYVNKLANKPTKLLHNSLLRMAHLNSNKNDMLSYTHTLLIKYTDWLNSSINLNLFTWNQKYPAHTLRSHAGTWRFQQVDLNNKATALSRCCYTAKHYHWSANSVKRLQYQPLQNKIKSYTKYQ